MAIIRGPRVAINFYHLDKRISEDKRLSWAARGLLIFLLGKPNHWRVNVSHLINETQGSERKSGKLVVYALLKELEKVGYLKRVRHHTGEMDYLVGEVEFYPESDNPTVDSDCIDPHPENPHLENPHLGFQPLVSIEEEVKKESKQTTTPDGFDDFWSAYPKKDAKQAARVAFKKLKPSQELLKTMLTELERHKRQEKWTKDRGQYVPNPATWLNGKRWEDEIEDDSGPGNVFAGVL